METLKKILDNPQTLSALGIILLITSFLDLANVNFLFIKLKIGFGVFLLAVYHILRSIVYFIESSD